MLLEVCFSPVSSSFITNYRQFLVTPEKTIIFRRLCKPSSLSRVFQPRYFKDFSKPSPLLRVFKTSVKFIFCVFKIGCVFLMGMILFYRIETYISIKTFILHEYYIKLKQLFLLRVKIKEHHIRYCI